MNGSLSVENATFPATFQAQRLDEEFSSRLALFEPLQPWKPYDSYAGSVGWTLYNGSCLATRDGDNCTAMCAELPLLFSSLPTLLTCMAAGAISSHFKSADLQSQSIAGAFGITENSVSPSHVQSSVVNCIGAFLKDPQYEVDTFGGTPDALSLLLNTVCWYADTTLDSDLGGIGVLLAFILQPSLACFGYIMLWILVVLAKWNKSHKRSTAQVARHYIAAVAALQEFLRTQCFFGITVQIAALYTMLSGHLSAASMAELMANYYFIQVVAINTILSVPFTLWYLRQHTMRSWYSYLLCLATFFLGIATFETADHLLGSVEYIAPVKDNALTQCGGFNPTTLCMDQANLGGDASLFYAMSWAISSVFMFWLTVDQIWHRLLREVFDAKPTSWDGQLSAKPNSQGQRWRRLWHRLQKDRRWGLRRCLWISCKLLTIGGLGYVFFFHFTTLKFYFAGVIITDWTIGQVVGVAVWFQPVFEFIQVDIGGLKSGFSHRVPKVLHLPESRLTETKPYSRSRRAWFDRVEEFFFCGTRPPRGLEGISEHGIPISNSKTDLDDPKQSSGTKAGPDQQLQPGHYAAYIRT